ncbi:MAG TPA: universal stress protein [Vicinamibacterales bacterium]|nr:universal stress protein [Vicinamibacterales bacterium]
MINLKTILVPSDFSECSEAAIRYGLELARRFDASLHLLHVVQDPATQPWAAEGFALPLVETVEQWRKDARLRLAAAVPPADAARVRCVATVAVPTEEILRYASANAVDLMVMGTHGRGGVSHILLGSITEKVIRRSPCPVLTVRQSQRDFVAPALAEAALQA